jgi:hypothetical protein
MDVTDIRLLSTAGILAVGVVTVAGAMAASFLAAWLVETGLAVAGWVGRLRSRAGESSRPAWNAPTRGASPGGERALLTREAPEASRLRC